MNCPVCSSPTLDTCLTIVGDGETFLPGDGVTFETDECRNCPYVSPARPVYSYPDMDGDGMTFEVFDTVPLPGGGL